MFRPSILVAAWSLHALIASGATYYVSTAGADSAAGTLAAPWATIQKAANTAVAGDTVMVRGGIYSERVTFNGRHGTSGQRIVFQNYLNETPVIDQNAVTPPGGLTALVFIQDCDYLTLQGFEIRNWKTLVDTATPAGIFITGAGSGIQILQNSVHDIWQSTPTPNDFNANGFGIAVYGTSATAIDSLLLSGNVVYNLRTGASESVVLNGNVTNFTVTGNTVHDCNNIGIDFIGFEGTNATAVLDQARSGECSGNIVYNIDSAYNPAYGGSFNANPPLDSARGAPGIYVDGGANITIERNLVYQSNIAVSVASEHAGKYASGVKVRDNVLHHCHVGGIFMGGADPVANGGTQNCSFTNNTLYLNDTSGYGGGQVAVQNNVSSCTVEDNIMVCNATTQQFVLMTGSNVSFGQGTVNWNLYSGELPTSVEFIWNGTSYYTFTAWKTASGQDANSSFTSNIGFSDAAANDFTLLATSPARDAGDIAFVAATGEKAFSGRSRVANGRVDIGADEYMTAWEAWRDQFFGLPDGGPGANPTDDPDKDGIVNVLEYALLGDPTKPSTGVLPAIGTSGSHDTIIFTRNLNATDLTYTIEASNDLINWGGIATKVGSANWSTNAGVSVSDSGTGPVTVTDSMVIGNGVRRFLRLRITQ